MGPNITDKDLEGLCVSMRSRIAEAQHYLDIYESEIARRKTAMPIKAEESQEPSGKFKSKVLETAWELICEEGEPVRQDRLARIVKASPEKLLAALNELEKLGLIARDKVIGSGNIIRVRTEDGRSAFV